MDAEQIAALQRRLIDRGLNGVREDDLLGDLCERLLELGVPVQRALLGFDTLHPVVEGRVTRWSRDSGETSRSEYTRADVNEDDWLQSPFYALEQSRERFLRRQLGSRHRQGEFPILDRLREEGLTDYLAVRIPFVDPEPLGQADSVYGSFATNRSDGFTERQVALIQGVLPALALAVKASSAASIARTLVETYLGRDAGRQVLSGRIERGATQSIRAIIWLSDLRGFTRIADTIAREQLVPLLNDYAACLATAVHDHGGQVLKFMGDGLLAIFDLDEAGAACSVSLDAALAARAGIASLNERRAAEGLPVAEFGLALHVGDLLYGNIGSWDRLDFTVIGPAVNEASRIEAMCGSLEQTVIVSSAFAQAAPDCRARLVSLGRYALRGVGRPQELFTLDPDALPG
jgi:adenylate cyclase